MEVWRTSEGGGGGGGVVFEEGIEPSAFGYWLEGEEAAAAAGSSFPSWVWLTLTIDRLPSIQLTSSMHTEMG